MESFERHNDKNSKSIIEEINIEITGNNKNCNRVLQEVLGTKAKRTNIRTVTLIYLEPISIILIDETMTPIYTQKADKVPGSN